MAVKYVGLWVDYILTTTTTAAQVEKPAVIALGVSCVGIAIMPRAN